MQWTRGKRPASAQGSESGSDSFGCQGIDLQQQSALPASLSREESPEPKLSDDPDLVAKLHQKGSKLGLKSPKRRKLAAILVEGDLSQGKKLNSRGAKVAKCSKQAQSLPIASLRKGISTKQAVAVEVGKKKQKNQSIAENGALQDSKRQKFIAEDSLTMEKDTAAYLHDAKPNPQSEESEKPRCYSGFSRQSFIVRNKGHKAATEDVMDIGVAKDGGSIVMPARLSGPKQLGTCSPSMSQVFLYLQYREPCTRDKLSQRHSQRQI